MRGYEDNIGAVNFVEADGVDMKLHRCSVGAASRPLDFLGLLIEPEVHGSGLTGCRARGCYHLPFTDPHFIKVENWFRQSWKHNVRVKEMEMNFLPESEIRLQSYMPSVGT